MVRNKTGRERRWNQGVDGLLRLPEGAAPLAMGAESMRSYSLPFGADFFEGAAFSLALLGFLASPALSSFSSFPAAFSSLAAASFSTGPGFSILICVPSGTA